MTLMRSIESWLRVEVEAERRKRRERKAQGLPEYEYDIGTDGTESCGERPGADGGAQQWVGRGAA